MTAAMAEWAMQLSSWATTYSVASAPWQKCGCEWVGGHQNKSGNFHAAFIITHNSELIHQELIDLIV
jgi:hypothetical protein